MQEVRVRAEGYTFVLAQNSHKRMKSSRLTYPLANSVSRKNRDKYGATKLKVALISG
jgi:hypothetical protein